MYHMKLVLTFCSKDLSEHYIASIPRYKSITVQWHKSTTVNRATLNIYILQLYIYISTTVQQYQMPSLQNNNVRTVKKYTITSVK